MPDDNAPAPPANGGDPPNPPAPAPPAPPAPQAVTMTSEQLTQRLTESRSSATKALLKDLGFTDVEAAKAAFGELKTLKTSQLSDAEKSAARIKELEPQAARATTLTATLTSLVEDQFKELPESARTAIDAIANGDPEKRLELMRVIKAAGGAAAPAPAPGPAPKPAPATITPGPAPAPAPGVKTKFDEWQERVKVSPMMGDIFYQQNARAIELSRPAS